MNKKPVFSVPQIARGGVISLLLLGVCAFFPGFALASSQKSSYYDFGPYYGRSQVLGYSFSSLENLPVPKIPDNLLPKEAGGITPGSIFYPLERAAENLQLTFTFNPIKKEELRLEFATERFSEAKTLVDQGKTEAASQALSDYQKGIKDIAEALSNLTQQGDSSLSVLVDKVGEVVGSQAIVGQTLSLDIAPAQAESWTAASREGQRLLDEVAETRGESPIPQDLSSRIQKLKDQGLLGEEESNKLYSFKTRSEVRSEMEKLASSGQLPASELSWLDTVITQEFPDVQQALRANFQVAELRTYQALPQPSKEVLAEIKKWQGDTSVPVPNEIKPYLWYSRAQEIAQGVDLSNFSADQQFEVAKAYPQVATENPTYSYVPLPSPTPSISPELTEQVPSTVPLPSPTPSVAQVSAEPYLADSSGALPGQPTYFLKQFGEQLAYTFAFSSTDRVQLKMQYAERRLAEARRLSEDPGKASLYKSTIENYRKTLEDASILLKNSAGDDGQKTLVAERLEAQAGRHEVLLEKGLLPSGEDPQLIRGAIRATEDAMDRSADVLERSALPASLSQRLGDLKAQGLILAEEAEDLVRSSSREEVREKVRKLVELNTIPLADAKKMDESQVLTSPSDYSQLVEVRKIEELQNLRSVQADLAQTPALKSNLTTLAQKETALASSFDPAFVKLEDLGGREDLAKTYERLASVPRPINGGQFGAEATPGAQPAVVTPQPQDAVLSACPEGAIFKQFEGCVWADNGRRINDYDQYKCEGPRQYYSFAVGKCVASDQKGGAVEDAQPICPIGYSWSWQNQSCQAYTGGGSLPLPTPPVEPEPKDDQEREKRAKSCPEGSSYQTPNGCVWDKSGKSVYDSEQYRCGRRQYYSFEEGGCVASPEEGQPYPKNTNPVCKEDGTFWSWNEGKCISAIFPLKQEDGNTSKIIIDDFRSPFIAPGSPFYIFKQAAERAQLALSFTAPARERVSLSQAKERLVEAADALKKNDEKTVKKALEAYTSAMQGIVADVSREQLSEGARKEISKLLAEESAEQNLLLERLSAWAPKEHDIAINAAVSATILGVDKAADIAGEPPVPDEVRSKIESLPEKMISEEDKKALLDMDSRVEARLKLGGLVTSGVLTQVDAAFLNEDFEAVDETAKIKVEELKKLEEITSASDSIDKIEERIGKNEEVVQKLEEFKKTFEVGEVVADEIRSYVKLTRIDEVTGTIRPDIVKLEDFSNRKDVVLAVATLQEEFRPTKEAFSKVEDFRRRNPNVILPPDLARIEALSYSLGVRGQASSCFLPSPPFPVGTPCPAPGAAIPIASYYDYNTANLFGTNAVGGQGVGATAPSLDKDGKPLVYGQGPKAESAGVCSSGYHWMYDSGGWCMSNSGSYSPSYTYTPTGTGSGYTPYSPYYTAPGAPPATYGYPGNNNYPASPYSYSPPSYYGTAPTYYTTNPPAGTVPGSGPKPTAPGQCPSGYHWMSDSGGWCMSDGPTYVPAGTTTDSTPPSGGYNCGSQPYDPVTKKCKDGACPGGYNWDGSKCVTSGGYSGGGSAPGSYQYGCTPGYYWDGSKCVAGSYSGGGWSDAAARSQSWCQPPSGGCGSNSYWDYGSCYCRSSSNYYGGSGPSPSNQCQGLSCGGGAWLDYSTCSCKYSGSTSGNSGGLTCYPPSAGCPGGWYDYGTCSCKSSSSSTGSSGGSSYCSPPSGGCGSGWWDSGSCSCRQASSQGCYNVSASSCGAGWYFDAGLCTCRQNSESSTTTTSGGTSGGSSSSGSCPSGYHWMSDSGGWCMSDGSSGSGGSSSSTTTTTTEPAQTTTPTTTTTTETSSQPAPAPTENTTTTTTTTEPAPAPTTSP